MFFWRHYLPVAHSVSLCERIKMYVCRREWIKWVFFLRQRWSCRCIIFRQMRTRLSVTKTTQRSIFASLGNLRSDDRSQIWMYLISCTLVARRGAARHSAFVFFVVLSNICVVCGRTARNDQIWRPADDYRTLKYDVVTQKNSFPFCFLQFYSGQCLARPSTRQLVAFSRLSPGWDDRNCDQCEKKSSLFFFQPRVFLRPVPTNWEPRQRAARCWTTEPIGYIGGVPSWQY